jgi:hypothetical protein
LGVVHKSVMRADIFGGKALCGDLRHEIMTAKSV